MADQVAEARAFAVTQHGDQKYGDRPFIWHPDEVAALLILFKHAKDEELLTAAYLHDVVEDTKGSLEDIREAFGDGVAKLVDLVTDRPGKNRAERQQATFPRIKGNARATALKLADRIANVHNSWVERPGLYAMYQKEWGSFYNALYVKGDGNQDKWDVLTRVVHYNPYERGLGFLTLTGDALKKAEEAALLKHQESIKGRPELGG